MPTVVGKITKGAVFDSVVDATDSGTSTTNFDGNLSAADDTVQKALDTLDDMVGGGYTDEEAQDAVGGILADSGSIDFTYTDATPEITAAVIPGGVDHNALANTHNLTTDIDHGSISGLSDDDHTQYLLASGARNIAGDILVDTDKKIFFRDAGLYIYSSADGTLHLVADTKIDLTAPTLDFNASTGASFTDALITGIFKLASVAEFQIRDDGLKISSSDDGQLDIDADVELEITAPTVDIDASVEVNISNALTAGGTISGPNVTSGADPGHTHTVYQPVGSYLENVSEDATPQLGGELDCQAHSIGFTAQTGTGDGTTTIDWKLGNKYHLLLAAASAPEVLTFTAPSKPCNLLLKITQHSTGGQTITWPATVMWPGGTAPTLSDGNNEIDIVSFYYDGTNYFGQVALNFSVPA